MGHLTWYNWIYPAYQPQTTVLPLKCGYCLKGNACGKVVDADDMAFIFDLCSSWINNDKDLDVFFLEKWEGDVSSLWSDDKEFLQSVELFFSRKQIIVSISCSVLRG